MNASLTSTLSEFAKRSEFSKNPVATEPPNKPPRHPTLRNLIAGARSWLGKLVSFAFARYLIAFFIGVTATLAWQSYGATARQAIAGWSPHLAWLAPPAARARVSADQRKATLLALAAVRQSVDKLATEVSKLQAQGARDGTSAPAPSRRGHTR